MEIIKIDNLQIDVMDKISYSGKNTLLQLYWTYHPRYRFFKNVPFKSRFLDVGAGPGGLQFWKEWGMPERKDIEMYAIDLEKGEFFDRYIDFQICDLDRDDSKFESDFFDIGAPRSTTNV